MKNNLLLTTALVSVAFAFTANAWAETGDATHKVTTADETISENLDGLHAGDKTDAQGGAVYHTKGTLTVKDGVTFSNNSAQQSGGAISAYSDVHIGDNVTFKNNTSIMNETEPKFNDNNGNTKSEMGGAIYVEGTGTKDGRKLTIGDNVRFEGNISPNGTVYLYNGVTAEIGDNVSFVDNEMGAVLTHATNTKKHPVGGSGALTLVGSENAKNKVTVGNNALFARNIADYGAGVINDQYGELEFKDNATFSANTARGEGGAISNVGKLTFGDNATFIGNKAEGTLVRADEQAVYGEGGAIINSGELTFNGTSTFKNNQAKYGGAIFADKLQNGKDDNTVITFKGDAVFDNNTASERGGALYLNNKDNKVTFEKGATFTNNSASNDFGGAIRNNGTLEFNGDTVFFGNRDKDGLNDIYNSNDAKITVAKGASLTLDGGISGQGTLTLGNDSNLTVNSQTEIASEVKTENSDKANLTVKIAAGDDGFDLKDIFLNSNNQSEPLKSFNFDPEEQGNNLYNIEQVSEDSTEYVAKEKSAAEVAANLGVNGSEAETVLTMMRSESNNDAFARVQDILGSLAQDKEVDSEVLSKAADAMVSDAAPTVRVRETMLSNMIFDTATDAMDDALTNAAVGQSSGDSLVDKAKVWVKGLFNYADRDDTNKSHGFDIDTYGVAFGLDKNVSPSVKLGAGYAYSQSDIDGYTRDTDVDTHTLFAYAKYKPANWYVNTVASYSFSDYKEKKSVLSYSADAKYDVDTFGLQSVYGYELNTNGYEITPEAGLRYLHIAKEGYVDELGTMAVSKNSNVLTALAGVKAAKTFELSNGLNIRPEVRAAVTYDLTSDNNDTRVVLPNGEALKVAGEDFDRFGFELGAKLATDITSNWEVAAGYEGRFREDYSDHTGILSAKYKF